MDGGSPNLTQNWSVYPILQTINTMPCLMEKRRLYITPLTEQTKDQSLQLSNMMQERFGWLDKKTPEFIYIFLIRLERTQKLSKLLRVTYCVTLTHMTQWCEIIYEVALYIHISLYLPMFLQYICSLCTLYTIICIILCINICLNKGAGIVDE